MREYCKKYVIHRTHVTTVEGVKCFCLTLIFISHIFSYFLVFLILFRIPQNGGNCSRIRWYSSYYYVLITTKIESNVYFIRKELP